MIVAAVVIVMAIATIVEKIHGTTFVSSKIYSTWWFSAIWGILAIASIARIITNGTEDINRTDASYLFCRDSCRSPNNPHHFKERISAYSLWRKGKTIHRAKQQRRYANCHPTLLRNA